MLFLKSLNRLLILLSNRNRKFLLQTTTAIPGLHKSMGIADERVKDVRIENDMLCVDLLDGWTISVPLAWYPKLFNASQRRIKQLGNCGRRIWSSLAGS
jgi:hypothetical protein